MSGRYDRRPLREWEQRPKRRSATEQIGFVRLMGFVLILAGSFVVLRPGSKHDVATPTSGADPRVAVDTAFAPVVRARLPHAQLTTGSSDDLLARVRGDAVVDLVILAPRPIALLASAERCSAPLPIAERGRARYVACLMNAEGSSRALAARALAAITGLEGRDALLAAGYDVPAVRPSGLAPTTPGAASSPPPQATTSRP